MRFVPWLAFLFTMCLGTCALAQAKPSGALDFGLDFHHSGGGHNVLGVHARAMAVDRVPGTLVGRFAEAYTSIGIGLDGELLQFDVGLKLGVGLGTDYLVIFLASGLMTDMYYSFDKMKDDVGLSDKDSWRSYHVGPGLGLPLALGFWIDPMPGLYFYFMAEPSWSFWGGDRKTTPFVPFNWAWELRLRGGVGFDVGSIHIRLDYTFHQVDPENWHVVSIGFGASSKTMAELGLTPK